MASRCSYLKPQREREMDGSECRELPVTRACCVVLMINELNEPPYAGRLQCTCSGRCKRCALHKCRAGIVYGYGPRVGAIVSRFFFWVGRKNKPGRVEVMTISRKGCSAYTCCCCCCLRICLTGGSKHFPFLDNHVHALPSSSCAVLSATRVV
jgi:hypothetical protein